MFVTEILINAMDGGGLKKSFLIVMTPTSFMTLTSIFWQGYLNLKVLYLIYLAIPWQWHFKAYCLSDQYTSLPSISKQHAIVINGLERYFEYRITSVSLCGIYIKPSKCRSDFESLSQTVSSMWSCIQTVSLGHRMRHQIITWTLQK